MMSVWGEVTQHLTMVTIQVPRHLKVISMIPDLVVSKFATTKARLCQMLQQHFSKSNQHSILIMDQQCIDIPSHLLMQIQATTRITPLKDICICLYVTCYVLMRLQDILKGSIPYGTMGSDKIHTKMESQLLNLVTGVRQVVSCQGVSQIHCGIRGARKVHERCALRHICAFVIGIIDA